MDKPVKTRNNECSDILVSAMAWGDQSAALALSWFIPWWEQQGWPVNEKGFPLCPDDFLLHAGALSMIAKYERTVGLEAEVRAYLPDSMSALAGLVERVIRMDTWFADCDEGRALMTKVRVFHQQFLLPLTQERPDGTSLVAMKCGHTVDSTGLEDLASLLIDFQHIFDTEGDKHDG